jgi:2,4-dienoyl-CoA reductase-like NADH-dependent reductase (Old Yellow Enzyme family)/NADPH-dependent 2,4-dienoyl-CoA reductase/sulfur reductase-like enzyme
MQLAAYDDLFIPGLKKIADMVHAQGSKAAMQLHHCGRESLYQLKRGQAMAPSAVPSLIFGGTPKEMTTDDIKEIIQSFGAAAVRAREAGFDAVELHGAHGYLLQQFLSAHSNQRTDEYGGDFRQRARFVVEVIQEVRRRVGEDFPISLRISVDEWIKGGYTPEDMQTVAPEFVKAGVDMIHASFGTHGSPAGITQAPIEYQPGFNVGLARKMKEVVDVPVIGVGRFTEPFLANECIARGDADLIAFGRQHLADPDFLINALNGRPEETIECLACNQGCIERLIFEGKSIRCAINPETGQELIYPQGPASASRKVWVVGAGPGGLTAAYEAGRLGHKVTVFEKEKETGGQVLLAGRTPFKEAYAKWIRKLAARAAKVGAEIRTDMEVTEELIAQGQPEVVILTGAKETTPALEGIDLPHVCRFSQILKGEVEPGKNVVIIGAGLVGMETADYLIQQGPRNITLVEQLEESPVSKRSSHGYMLHTRLNKAGCRMLFNTTAQRIEPDGVVAVCGGEEQRLAPVDQVVIATGTVPNDSLKQVLDARGIKHYIIGDAAGVRRIIEAVEEGARAAWDIS